MIDIAKKTVNTVSNAKQRFRTFVEPIPLLGWICGALVSVLLERFVGLALARALGLPKIPALLGCMLIFKDPQLIPGALAYLMLIYCIPVTIAAKLTVSPINRIVRKLHHFPIQLPEKSFQI